ncbi:sugar efflux transporter [Cellvibrio japonicus]|uniref:Sugar efflux transporter A n=1 Tax=Cellvibrio japonicus (strain Ueda107) TaxID=498211 RepID=B3PDI7_CELJU|nr:sugar efflux transporter [Cellvibrio japonicus]ACE83363.1 Sugar efflux transporter A [Cellvibrio japonicus Ueda107]
MTSPLFRPVALGIYLLFFAVGVVGALVLPTFSLFLAKEIGVRPLLVGLPFAGIALTSIAYNHWIGLWSDKLRDRRPLVAAFCVLGFLACLVFAFSRHYGVVAVTAVLVFSLAMVSFSQMLAYSLDYAEGHIPPERIPLFNAIVRAQIAFAWVAGPPAGFLLASYLGFHWSYAIAAVLYLLVALASIKLLPLLPRRQVDHASGGVSLQPLAPAVKQSLAICALAFSLLWGVNNAYLISLPIHLKDNLAIDTQWMGWVMGTTAALEVPFMLLAGYYAARVPLMALIRCAGIAALLLYLGVYVATELWQLFALQIFNAVFIGVLAGLGVSVIQELMPGRSGSASALYTNTTHVGNLFSSLMVGVVADYWGYQQVFAVNILLVVMAIWAFGYVRSGRELASSLHPR